MVILRQSPPKKKSSQKINEQVAQIFSLCGLEVGRKEKVGYEDMIRWLWANNTKSQLLDPFHLLYLTGSRYGILWYIYLHLVDFYGKCKEIYHT